ncbi:protein phosphatase 2C domain-containing protein [Lentzea guizhouensis]|nr:protein phosphatase 2C domain-containing protein [Lentzea guizhouensis]
MRADVMSEPGDAGVPNDDFVVLSPEVCVLLDGVTPQADDDGCAHGVGWFVRTLGSALMRRLSGSPGAPLGDCVAAAITETAREHRRDGGRCDLGNRATPQATLLVVRCGPTSVDYFVLGDVTLLVDRPAGLLVITDDRGERLAQEFLHRYGHLPAGSGEAREAWDRYRALRNAPGGYWTAAADPHAARQGVTGAVARDSARGLLAMTDGATRYADLFGLTDWAGVHRLVTEHGVDELITRLRTHERAHPEPGRRRTKISDDATVVRIQL